MKRIFTVCIPLIAVTVLFSGICTADSKQYKSISVEGVRLFELSGKPLPSGEGFWNGRFWNELNKDHKTIYVEGLYDGIEIYEKALNNFDSIFASALPKGEWSLELLKNFDKRILPKLDSSQEIIIYIDTFYSQPLNLNIPIICSWLILCKESNGQKVDNDIMQLRKKYVPL